MYLITYEAIIILTECQKLTIYIILIYSLAFKISLIKVGLHIYRMWNKNIDFLFKILH